MGGRVKLGIELRISYSDTILNYRFSQKFKLLENGEFNHLTINLTDPTREHDMNPTRVFSGWVGP